RAARHDRGAALRAELLLGRAAAATTGPRLPHGASPPRAGAAAGGREPGPRAARPVPRRRAHPSGVDDRRAERVAAPVLRVGWDRHRAGARAGPRRGAASSRRDPAGGGAIAHRRAGVAAHRATPDRAHPPRNPSRRRGPTGGSATGPSPAALTLVGDGS